MQAERWKRIEDLYQAALAQPPEKRAAFLLHVRMIRNCAPKSSRCWISRPIPSWKAPASRRSKRSARAPLAALLIDGCVFKNWDPRSGLELLS
jgi:hypothetical protein